ncbi:MAG TPA: endo-1,4-beta-xylanase [Sphingomonas sp.]|nr:endo-1,4-beta-xylanase [Sphingomonas sp.]
MEDRLSRREALALTLALTAGGCSGGGGGTGSVVTPAPTPAPSTPAPPPTVAAADIKGAAAAKRMRFGSAVAWSLPGADAGSFANPAYAALLERDCAILVPENELKWQSIRPDAATFDFSRFDAMLAWAEAHGLAMRGHNLLWHQRRWMPAWAESHNYGSGTAEAERILSTHIQTVCRRYGSRIVSYDVVNEAVDPSTSGLYETALSQALGGAQATLDLAFRTARAEAPNAELVYNDYMGWEAGSAAHRAGVLALLRGFRSRGVPVDALGIQSHIGIYSNTPVATLIADQTPAWRAFLDEVVGMGYRLVVTELDVRDRLTGSLTARDQAIADYCRGWLDLLFAYPQLRDVLVWGMSDKYSWLQSFEPRTDGQPHRPCPYDTQMQPKLMQNAIAAAFAATTVRP